MQNLQSLLKYKLLIITTLFTLLLTANTAKATIVRFETSLGNIDVNLYDETTPQSVENFLNYVTAGSYGNTLFHRSVSGFILQGGGFLYNNTWPPIGIQSNVAVNNEPIYSNVRGTLAYAKLSGLPNSATNQWFFNLANNAANLDNQNSGFTVFGEVMGNGMDVVDAIAALNTYNLGSSFSEIPLQNYTSGDPNDTNIILITNISVIDSSINTAAGLNPTATTRATESSSTSSGGGSLGILILLLTLTSRLVVGRNEIAKSFI
ncbi:MAG: peptidylprolyl isomerase [Kangiellaceae bacterium]